MQADEQIFELLAGAATEILVAQLFRQLAVLRQQQTATPGYGGTSGAVGSRRGHGDVPPSEKAAGVGWVMLATSTVHQ